MVISTTTRSLFLSWMLVFGICCSVVAQPSEVHTFNLSPIPKHIQKVKPYRHVQWQRGTISLNSGDQITGYLYYEPQEEVLLAYQNTKILTFRPYQIHGFDYYDRELRLFRQYQSISNDPSKGIKRYKIYEAVTEGSFSLLRKEASGKGVWNRLFQQRHIDYFIWDGQLVWPYRQFQKQVLPLLAQKDRLFKELLTKKNASRLTLLQRQRMIYALNRITASYNKPVATLLKSESEFRRLTNEIRERY